MLIMVERPVFKPNRKIGEGKPTKWETEYRVELLKRLEKEVYKPINKFINSKKLSPEQKTAKIDEIITRWIHRTQQFVDTEITSIYLEGVSYATDRLKKAGATHNPVVPDKPEQIQALIRQQKNNVYKIGTELRNKLVGTIDIKDNMGYYGSKDE